jgi:hypothetical protein
LELPEADLVAGTPSLSERSSGSGVSASSLLVPSNKVILESGDVDWAGSTKRTLLPRRRLRA